MNAAWLMYFGHAVFHMSRLEILATKYGEFCDMIACNAIQNGGAEQRISGAMAYDDFINALR